ncbi:hypothetical protein D3C71_2059610 [compost metagenome]
MILAVDGLLQIHRQTAAWFSRDFVAHDPSARFGGVVWPEVGGQRGFASSGRIRGARDARTDEAVLFSRTELNGANYLVHAALHGHGHEPAWLR